MTQQIEHFTPCACARGITGYIVDTFFAFLWYDHVYSNQSDTLAGQIASCGHEATTCIHVRTGHRGNRQGNNVTKIPKCYTKLVVRVLRVRQN